MGRLQLRERRRQRHPDRAELRFTAVLAALSDPTRLTIVTRLADAGPDGELACGTFALGISKSTQSGHFKVLRESGVIHQRDEGTRRMNRLRRDDLDARFPGLLDLALRYGSDAIGGVSLRAGARGAVTTRPPDNGRMTG